ncbi:MAG TPA: hypothetical protein VNQ80_14090 [Parapedobacter sp.]|uniref:hypothetical protein n=1 Tax=Parapedobacter sp. TaxID=1958893 RepID=UPI002BEBE7BE|nr:hypothetical protein [Parapedobacter sp.]HWK58470.1 hypothetical protein [Parapedobacter sp.]
MGFKEITRESINITNVKVAEKLYGLRALLLLSRPKIGAEVGVDSKTIGNFEEGRTGGQTDKLSALIFFYGFTHKEFYDFDKPLPTEKQLKSRMKRFHEAIGSDAYKIIYDRPDLIDLIEFRLLATDLFSEWVTAEQVISYCKTKYHYEYLPTSVPNTLDNAVKKGWLVVDDKAKPKRYRKK